jgi:hypothetical protein
MLLKNLHTNFVLCVADIGCIFVCFYCLCLFTLRLLPHSLQCLIWYALKSFGPKPLNTSKLSPLIFVRRAADVINVKFW